MAGLVPAIHVYKLCDGSNHLKLSVFPMEAACCLRRMDARDEPGHDGRCRFKRCRS